MDYVAGMEPEGADVADGTFLSPQGHRVHAYTNRDEVMLVLDPATGRLVEDRRHMPQCQES